MTAALSPPSEKALTIAVVTHYYDGHGGGIEHVAHTLINEVSSLGTFHFIWMASDCDPAPVMKGQTTAPMASCNVIERMLGLPMPLWGWKSLRALRRTIQKADLLWLHDTLYSGNIAAFLFAKRAGKPIIITQHIAPIPYRNPLLRWLMRLADQMITAPMLKNADEVIFISDRVADDYYRRVAFTKPIKVIPNGVEVRLFHPPIAENRRFLRQQFALKNDQPVLLFVGRFVEKKGLDVIHRLALFFPDWRFWLAGNGSLNPTAWLLPNVHVFSDRKGQSLAELYQAADLLLMPSYGEGFPLVIQEAMACGLPVLCAPETAQGCAPAAAHLHLAEVWPNNAERTAAVWYEKLKAFPLPLPLIAPIKDIAEFALLSWDWPPITRVYADILKKMRR